MNQSANKRPNIVIILLDDMGYSDIGCYGGEIQTPAIDALAAGGVRLARFYNAAQCCPSRATLMSGLYPHQAGMGDMNALGPSSPYWQKVGAPGYLGFRKNGIVTLPEALREAGYQTFMSGKWHLGDTPDNWPSERGFDRTFSLIIGASEHFSGRRAWKTEGPIAPFILDGKKLDALPPDFYTTDTFTDYALRFIEESDRARPWFCYLAYTAPHWPLECHPRDEDKYKDVYRPGPEAVRRRRVERLREMGLFPSGAALPGLEPTVTREAIERKTAEWELWMRRYAGMIDCVDQNIARLVGLLRRRGELDNTLILFMSDNGADTVRGPLWGLVSNTPFRRSKVWTHEGGIATPLIAHWPSGIPAARNGAIIPGYGHFIDLLPTCLEAAGAEHPRVFHGEAVAPLEGVSLLPALQGRRALPEDRILYWERQGNEAIRQGNWKLVRGYNDGKADGAPDGEGPRAGAWELHDLATDPGETRDLSTEHPGLVKELLARYEAWAGRVGVVPRERIVEATQTGQ